MPSVGTLSRVPEYSENRKRCIYDGDRLSRADGGVKGKLAALGNGVMTMVERPPSGSLG
jgi:hypothetical protein